MADPDDRSAPETPAPYQSLDRHGKGAITDVVAGAGFRRTK
jgi:hypothetical protein